MVITIACLALKKPPFFLAKSSLASQRGCLATTASKLVNATNAHPSICGNHYECRTAAATVAWCFKMQRVQLQHGFRLLWQSKIFVFILLYTKAVLSELEERRRRLRRVRRDHKCISASSRHFCLNGVNASWIRKGQSCKKPSILDSLTLLWELAASTVQSFLTPSQATSHKSTTNLLSCPQLKRELKLNIRSHRIWKEQEDDLRYVKELYCVATHRSIMQVQ